MENSLQSSPDKEYDLKQNSDGSTDISFRQQTMDPAMMAIFILPIFFFTSCFGILAVDNTFGIPGGIYAAFVVIVVVLIAGYFGIDFFNTKNAQIKIIPGRGIEFGSCSLTDSAIEKIGTQAGNLGTKGFRVYAIGSGEKTFITEYLPAARARAIQNEILDQLKKT